MKDKLESLFSLSIMASLTLGLAPFLDGNPARFHAHIWKQLTNIWYSRTMTGMDWFDLAMHGAPWILLIIILGIKLEKLIKGKKAIN